MGDGGSEGLLGPRHESGRLQRIGRPAPITQKAAFKYKARPVALLDCNQVLRLLGFATPWTGSPAQAREPCLYRGTSAIDLIDVVRCVTRDIDCTHKAYNSGCAVGLFPAFNPLSVDRTSLARPTES